MMKDDFYSLFAVYTVEEAVEQIGFGIFQVKATVASGLAWV